MKIFSRFYIGNDDDEIIQSLYLGYNEITVIPSRDLKVLTMETVKKLIQPIKTVEDFYSIGDMLLSKHPKGDNGYCSIYIGDIGRKKISNFKFKKLLYSAKLEYADYEFPNRLDWTSKSSNWVGELTLEDYYEGSEQFKYLSIPKNYSFKSKWELYLKDKTKHFYGYLDLLTYFTYKLNFS